MRLLRLIMFTVVTLTGAMASAQLPALLPIHGVLADAEGTPIDGEVEMHVGIYGVAERGVALWEQTLTVEVDHGVFTALIGEGDVEALSLDLFRDNHSLWIGIAVGEDDEMERIAILPVPYAGYAEHAGMADRAAIADGLSTPITSADAGLTVISRRTESWTGTVVANPVNSPRCGEMVDELVVPAGQTWYVNLIGGLTANTPGDQKGVQPAFLMTDNDGITWTTAELGPIALFFNDWEQNTWVNQETTLTTTLELPAGSYRFAMAGAAHNGGTANYGSCSYLGIVTSRAPLQ